MAKTSQAALIWSQEDQHYLWRDEQDTETLEGDEKPEAWQRRLVASTSFSFQGREGHLTPLKEGRPRGREGYWYAYRRQGKRTVKKYARRTADLTLLRGMPQPPFEASLPEAALTVFLNALAQCERGGVLVLDDYQTITSQHIHQTITFFLAYLPGRHHVILITRNDPQFPLARLRARNDLCEVRSSGLRFSPEGTSAFLQQSLPVPLAPEIVLRV
ncbi:MAG TPA: hypothetical protein VFN35_04115, partial [Ktedonobacteraceae bacterium]|nr:hypothetical protein [Ktedonobacteraceae bacterium]